ncbi:hypothetical protein ACCX84_03560 [Pantoea trifolii]|uniref:hypothetical protein n=1 Tax=Pantoea trifolii TaxID=2968030 RepID=UPI003EDAACA4
MWLDIKDGKIEVNGIDDAHKLVNLPQELAGNLADYALHITDLNISLGSLEAINKVGIFNEEVIQESLWRSAIIHFVKCFSNQVSRGKLDPNLVFGDEPPEAMLAFSFFKNMRNKNIAHDENAYLQCLNGIVLNNGTKNYKVERIICTSIRAASLDSGTFSNLILLVNKSLEYVQNHHSKLCEMISIELEKKSYSELKSYGDVKYIPPDVNKIQKPRK